MPTVLRINGYRFFFFSNEGNEPIHIHVEKAECYAKFWIQPISLAYNYNYTTKQLNLILEIIEQNKELIKIKWDEYFSK